LTPPLMHPPPLSTLFPYTTLFRSSAESQPAYQNGVVTQTTTARANPDVSYDADPNTGFPVYDSYNNGSSSPWSQFGGTSDAAPQDRKSTRLNSSHEWISYAVFCLK